MMKKSAIVCVSAALFCPCLISIAGAALIDTSEEWGITLDNGQSLTCVAHYIPDINGIPDSLIFSAKPVFTSTYTGGDSEKPYWHTAISPDQKTVYLFGITTTNNTGSDNVGWFSYNLYFQWDDTDPNLDLTFPVYMDTAVFNGPEGCDPYDKWGWRGHPDLDNWQYQPDPYYVPEQGEDDYTNPAPEPATICLLTLSSALLRIRKRPLKNYHRKF